MRRRDFLKFSALGAAALAVAPPALVSAADPNRRGRAKSPELRISFQDGIAPGKTLAEQFDWMEAYGVSGYEPGGGRLWERVASIKSELAGRDIVVTAICAGFGGFILAEDASVKREFDESMRRIIASAGELGSTGVIMVPAFNGQKPCRPHTLETREFLVEQLAELGDFATEHGTTVILEPLNHREAFYLRQVGDAAAIARDTGSKGVRCMGDFWHMSEEVSDYGALWSGGEYLNHVHIASRGRRVMPGEDGDLDNYRDGFRALQQMDYRGFVSFECGSRGDRNATVPAALELLRGQWANAI